MMTDPDNIVLYADIVDRPVDAIYIAQRYRIEVHIVSGTEWEAALDNTKKPIIYLRHDLTPERQRFLAAHALGHYFLHRDDQPAFREYFNRASGDAREDEADAFARKMLLPAPWVQAFARYESEQVLAQKFRVEADIMSIRLKELGISARLPSFAR